MLQFLEFLGRETCFGVGPTDVATESLVMAFSFFSVTNSNLKGLQRLAGL
jgi:hypothetical protein